jgi:hypothetical protein
MAQPVPAPTVKKPVGPNGGWGDSEEQLLAEWADKAACYRWLHDCTEKKYRGYNMALTIPVIILSTLTGTANFGMSSIFPPDLQPIAQLGVGGVSLIAGMVTTVANFLQYAQGMEAHRSSGISWGKLQRKISVELALPRSQRENCMDFLLVSRSELDRLIESSPSIPEDSIARFEKTFKTVKISKPEVCNNLQSTKIHDSKNENMAEITAKAAELMKETISNKRVEALKKLMEPKVREEILKEVNRRRSSPPKLDTSAIIRQDLENLARSGVVSAMKNNKTVQIILPKQSSGILKVPEAQPEEVKIDMPQTEPTS